MKKQYVMEESVHKRNITNVNSEELPWITKDGIEAASKQLKNRKAVREGNILSEMLKIS